MPYRRQGDELAGWPAGPEGHQATGVMKVGPTRRCGSEPRCNRAGSIIGQAYRAGGMSAGAAGPPAFAPGGVSRRFGAGEGKLAVLSRGSGPPTTARAGTSTHLRADSEPGGRPGRTGPELRDSERTRLVGGSTRLGCHHRDRCKGCYPVAGGIEVTQAPRAAFRREGASRERRPQVRSSGPIK